MPLNAPVN